MLAHYVTRKSNMSSKMAAETSEWIYSSSITISSNVCVLDAGSSCLQVYAWSDCESNHLIAINKDLILISLKLDICVHKRRRP